MICAGCLIAHAAALLLLAAATQFWMVVAFAVIHGFSWGMRGPLMSAIRADYFGSASFGTIAGFSSMIVMFGMIIGPILAGVLADRTGSYALCKQPETSSAVAFTFSAGVSSLERVLLSLASAQPSGAEPPSGLCARCAHARTVTSGKGSTFVLCGKSAQDPRFPKYPRLPVLRCDGFAPASDTPS